MVVIWRPQKRRATSTSDDASSSSSAQPAPAPAPAAGSTSNVAAELAAIRERRRKEGTKLSKELCNALEFGSVAEVGAAVLSIANGGYSFDTPVSTRTFDGGTHVVNPMTVWAHDRHDADEKFYSPLEEKKPFLSQILDDEEALDTDAAETLSLILSAGANPHVKSRDGKQSPLHVTMCYGHKSCIKALLEHVNYTIDLLSQQDEDGDTALHAALSNGMFESARMVLFSPRLNLLDMLNTLEDRRGDNLLAALVRYTDVPYDNSSVIRDAHCTSDSLQLLKDIILFLKQSDDIGPFLKKNKKGETAMAVAAKCGVFYEVKALASITYMNHWPVASICTHADGIGAGAVLSPLDLAKRTEDMIEDGASAEAFEEIGICGAESYLSDQRKMNSWSESIGWTIDFLENLETPRTCTMEDVRRARCSDGSAKIVQGQILSPIALELRNQHARSYSKDPPRLDFDQHVGLWDGANPPPGLTDNIKKRLKNPRTVGSVKPAMIRNPKDPCHRASIGPCRHFGLFAVSNIPKHTIICEYGGIVRREDEGGYNPTPEYSVKLEKCDEYVRASSTDPYANGFMLDGEVSFNEGSLINDTRWSLLGEEDVEHRTENVVFLEVIVNGWPHTFVVANRDIKKQEELLLDYGPEYWEKILNQRTAEIRREEKKQRQDMKDKIVKLRDEKVKYI